MKRKSKDILMFALLIIACGMALIEYFPIKVFADNDTNDLFIQVLARLLICLPICGIIILLGFGKIFTTITKPFYKALVWCLPCLAVAVVNFPFTAVIGGAAIIDRTDLIWLFIAKCIAIGLMEEFIFRGLLQKLITELLSKMRHRAFLTVLISSVLFALFHLLNLFSGGGVGSTLLQVGYSFLIGAMLSAVMLRTGNIFICVFIHALFDFGGMIIPTIGGGAFQDTTFWILTAVFGVICAAHIGWYLYKTDKNELLPNA